MADGNKNLLLIVVAVAALAVSVLLIGRNLSSHPAASGGVWFYDVATGSLFVAAPGATPPIVAPGGGQGVKALVAGCGSCDEADLRVVHLETLSEEAVAALAQMKANSGGGGGPPPDALVSGQRVALPPDKPGDEPAWVRQDSPQGMAVMSRTPDDACGGGAASICSP